MANLAADLVGPGLPSLRTVPVPHWQRDGSGTFRGEVSHLPVAAVKKRGQDLDGTAKSPDDSNSVSSRCLLQALAEQQEQQLAMIERLLHKHQDSIQLELSGLAVKLGSSPATRDKLVCDGARPPGSPGSEPPLLPALPGAPTPVSDAEVSASAGNRPASTAWGQAKPPAPATGRGAKSSPALASALKVVPTDGEGADVPGRAGGAGQASQHSQESAKHTIQDDYATANESQKLDRLFDSPIETGEQESDRLPTRLARKMTRHRHFELGVSGLIVANAIFFGVQSDWSIKNIGQRSPVWFTVVEYTFSAAFTCELLLHIMDEGCAFLKYNNPSFQWNVFDTILVVCSWSEDIVNIFNFAMGDTSIFRTFRIARLVRVLRILRAMKTFRQLRTMVRGIMASLQPLVWCLVLLCVVMFTFGVFILQLAVMRIADSPSSDHVAFLDNFGGMMLTLYTLFRSMTGGIDWGDAAELLIEINPAMATLFSLFISFAVLCVLNIVTGVFVDNANTITREDTDNMVMEELSCQEKRLEEMRGIFVHAVESGSELLTEEQFVIFSQCNVVQAYFRKIGLHVERENARALFRLIDLECDGTMNLKEFVEGCMQFIGNARQLDIARLRRDIQKLTELTASLVLEQRDGVAIVQQAGLSRSLSRVSICTQPVVEASS